MERNEKGRAAPCVNYLAGNTGTEGGGFIRCLLVTKLLVRKKKRDIDYFLIHCLPLQL